MGVDLAIQAKAISSGAGVPLMVHIGDIPADHPKAGEATIGLLSEVLGPGDIVTHTCSNHVGGLLDNGKLRPEAKAARERGVWFDVGVGRANFAFDSAKAVMDQGLIPDTISSDVTAAGRLELVHGLTESMNKFLALSMSLSDVVRMTTRNSAKVLGMEGEIGGIARGEEADLSVLSLATGDWIFRDPTGGTATSTQAIVPEFAVRTGIPQPLDPGPRPWGWLPESAT
jgi:dihydroorotase